jgi:putative phosphoesterase
MKIAVISDSHDNVWKLDEAMPHLNSADAVIHCGDLCAPFVVRKLGEGLGDVPLHVVWGNNDGDPFLIGKVASGFPHVSLHGILAELELDGLKLAVNHYPRIARGLALSRQYGLVCYGHDHTANEEWVDDCLLLNPGEMMGMHGRSSLAIVDTQDRSVEWIEV